ncbi:hypothetical protein C8F04DRAFT_1177290 [Mycena alexandri]|uniref:Uncharacterized protein n=1 Tax=Mycena alexandri TaxID=1745969 RepID=A0AAD6TAF9_9AGAR|nr:hypothetical protein C8F04DRAFT_1177290 [Mycena alexandri]
MEYTSWMSLLVILGYKDTLQVIYYILVMKNSTIWLYKEIALYPYYALLCWILYINWDMHSNDTPPPFRSQPFSFALTGSNGPATVTNPLPLFQATEGTATSPAVTVSDSPRLA